MPFRYHDLSKNYGTLACKVCKGTLKDLPTECPGREMSKDEIESFRKGLIDYIMGQWIRRIDMQGNWVGAPNDDVPLRALVINKRIIKNSKGVLVVEVTFPSELSLKQARVANYLSQGDLASLLGVSQVLISAWELGKEPVPKARRRQIEKILNLPIKYKEKIQ